MMKVRGTFVPHTGDKKDMICLNRLVGWCDCWELGEEAIEREAEMRHVDILRFQLALRHGSRGLENSRCEREGNHGQRSKSGL